MTDQERQRRIAYLKAAAASYRKASSPEAARLCELEAEQLRTPPPISHPDGREWRRDGRE